MEFIGIVVSTNGEQYKLKVSQYSSFYLTKDDAVWHIGGIGDGKFSLSVGDKISGLPVTSDGNNLAIVVADILPADQTKIN